MKRIVIAALALLPWAVLAEEVEMSERLREAELRLEQAAQEIAELHALQREDSLRHLVKTFRHAGGEGRAMLGITISHTKIEHDGVTVESGREAADGVLINGVTPGGPADEAGLESGDVILALNGTSLVDGSLAPMRRLTDLLEDVTPGDTVSVRYRRGDADNTIQVVTGEFSPMAFAFGGHDGDFEFHFDEESLEFPEIAEHFAHLSRQRAWRGLELVALTPKLGRYFDAERGLLVVSVPDNDAVSLEEGDVILSIAGATPDTPPEAMSMLRFYEPGDEVVMEIRRQGRDKTLKLVIPE